VCHLANIGGKNNRLLEINALRELETLGRRPRVSAKRAPPDISAKSTTEGAEALTFCQEPAPSEPLPFRQMACSDNQQ
jgi:hypothetical protein